MRAPACSMVFATEDRAHVQVHIEDMRLYKSVLVETFMLGAGLHPKQLPRPRCENYRVGSTGYHNPSRKPDQSRAHP